MVRDDGIEDSPQRVPLQFKITSEFVWGDKKFHDFFFPELAIAIGESGLNINVATKPSEIKGLVIVPDSHLSMLALAPGAIILVKRFEHGRFAPGRLIQLAIHCDRALQFRDH